MPRQLIPDEIYRKELERLSGLAKFPEIPNAQKELIRAMRRITESDVKFLHNLITGFVDTADTCPMPSDLYERASQMRATNQKPLGNPSCMKCGGTGWVHGTRMVKVANLDPYEADCSQRCTCAPPVARSDAA